LGRTLAPRSADAGTVKTGREDVEVVLPAGAVIVDESAGATELFNATDEPTDWPPTKVRMERRAAAAAIGEGLIGER
jgi:hypothetical protein